MNIVSAVFLKSSVVLEACPEPTVPEFAFVGRSNVGKSSLINSLLNKKALAKTSQTPGKTRTINHFDVQTDAGPWYAVDLPGYGFAKIAIKEKRKWQAFVRKYLMGRPNLYCTFVLIDVRHPMLKADQEFMVSLSEMGMPFALLFTKADKLTPGQLTRAVSDYLEELLTLYAALPNYFVTSAETRMGRDQVLAFIEETAFRTEPTG